MIEGSSSLFANVPPRGDRNKILTERMAVPIFINNVFCGALSDGPEPLGAEGAHPDEVAGGNRVPVVAEPVDAAAFEHEEAVLHNVDFDLAEGGSGCVGHGVDGEVERG